MERTESVDILHCRKKVSLPKWFAEINILSKWDSFYYPFRMILIDMLEIIFVLSLFILCSGADFEQIWLLMDKIRICKNQNCLQYEQNFVK